MIAAGEFTVTGGTLIGAIANYVKIDGADKNHPVYIDGNCFNISGKTIRNAVIKKASYLRELYNMENITIQEAEANDALHWNWTGEYTLTDCNLSGVRIRCRNTDTLTMTNSTVGTVENFKKVIATNSTIEGVGDSSSGRVGVSVTEAILTGSTVGGPITADNIELRNTNVTGTVTAPATGKITVGGSTTVTDLYLKNGQKFYVNNLSNNAKINVRSDGAGDLIANPPGYSLEGKATTSSGELNFSDDGQVTIVPSLDHEGKSYTALVQGSSEWTGTHQYYLTQDWTGSITIPSGADITLCLHAYDFTGDITVEEGGTLYLEVESTWYNPKSTIYGQIVNNGTLELRKVGWSEPSSGINHYDYNCIDVNSGSKTAIVNNGTLTWHCHNKSYVVENESLSTVTNNGTAPTIVNSGTMDVQKITVINNGAGPVLSNTAGTARLAGTLTTVGNSEAVHVSGGEVKITQVTSGASGENSAAIVAAGGSVECVHDRNGKAALSAPKAETVIRVEPNGEFKFGSGYNSAPEFGTGTKYTLVNNGGTVSIGGNNKISGVMLNKAGTMNLANVQATGKGQVVVDGGELTVSGAAAAEDLKNDIIMLNGGAVVLAGGTYRTNTGYYAVRVANKDARLTAKGGVDMTNSAVYLCTDAKMAVLREGDTAPRVKIVMETPGVFAENVTEDLTSTVSSANANYAVKYNAEAKTLSLELTGEHKHDSTTYKQLKDTDTALTAGCYYLPQSVKMEHDLTISGDVTICLNGSTLSFGKFGSGSSDYYKVKVQDGGTLTIQDELTGGGKLTDGGIQLAPTADFTLESGTLEAKEAVRITGSTESTNTNTVTIKGGAITALWAVRNVVSGATVNVTGGTLTMPPAYTYGYGSDYDYQALIGMNGGTLNISGGTWVQENKTFGMLVDPSSTTDSDSTGTVTVTGGSFTIGRRGFELYDGTANFSNVIFTTLSGNSNLSNAIRCYGNAQVKLNKVTFDMIRGVSVSDTANATLTDVTVKTYSSNTQLVNVGQTASATVESASIQTGTGTYNRAAIDNAGTLNVKKLTVADGISLNVSNSGGTATYNNLDLSNGKTYFTVSGGTMNLEGGSFAADTDMFTVKGGTANVNGCTLALKNNSEKSKYNRYFFQLTGGETNLNGGALVADTGTKYPYVANGTGGTLKLDGELKYTKVEEGAVLRTMLAAPDNYKIALGDSFSSAAPITFRFEGISLDFADTVWTATQKKNFAMPKGYTWASGEGTTGIKKEAPAEHSHKDGTQFYKALSEDITAEDGIKTYTIPADNLYLTKDITWTIKEGYDSCHRFTMNGERYLCLNRHDLALKLGTRETWSKLYSTDAARQKLTITNCAEHPSTIYGSIDLGYSGYSWDKYNPTDRLVLENLTVAGRIDMRKVKYTGEDYTTSLDHVTVTPADDFGSTVQLGAGKHIIKNSTLTYNEPDSYKDYAYGALYLENANAKVTLEGTVNITGGFGLYGRGGTVDTSRLSPDSKIVLGAGKSAIYDEYKYTITGVTEELRSCFTLSNYAPTSSYKPENYRLVYDAEAQTLKIEEVETHYDKDSKVELTVSSSKYAFASGEPATLYAYWNTNDSACTLESYQWYAVDANGKKTSIPGATERTYTTDTLTPGTHKFTAVAYYTVTNSNRTYRKDATNDIIVKVNAAVDINADGITITGFTNGTKTYDGTAVSYDGTATAEGYTGEFEYKWFKDGENTLLTTAPKDAGKYYLKVGVPSGAAGYSGEAKIAFTISPATITVTPTANQSKVYGTADTALTYMYTGAVNSETANFIGALSRETGENAGIYAITQGNLALEDKDTFKASNYTLVFSEDMGNFTVSPKMLTADMVATITDQTYTGNAIKPAITVTDSEKTLTADDYTVTYESNTNAGTATVKITGKGNYTDEVSKTFTINPKALENDMITAIDAQVYTGKAITPEPEVKYGEIKLEKDTDYTVSYESNTAVGTAAVTVTAVASGNYVGSATANFAIGRADQTLGKTDMTATYGETFEVTPITGAQGEVIYAVKSGSESLLTKGEDGKFTAKSGTGTAYITATAAQTANYKQTSIDIPVELSKAHLTAKADDKSMYVNDTVPADLTVSYTGFVNGDTKDMVVDKDATASIAAEVDGKTTGTFAITTNTDTKLKPGMEDNYTVAVQNGTLTISSRSSDGTGDGAGQTTYPVTVPDKTDNGSVSVNPKSAKQGDTVTITVTPDKGYILETITVTDKDGEKLTVTKKSDTEYTFVMPASEVEVKATFMADNTMLNYFVDVKAADYYYDAVLWAAQNGITNGTDATHFSPDGLCTRAQAVTFLWRFERCPAAGGENPFSDVSSRVYYADAILWAVERGITNGTSETTFGPDESATRAQIVTFLYRDIMK